MREEPRRTTGEAFARLVEIVATLRAENGCPWDRAQTLDTLKGEMLEEAYEYVEAVEERRPSKMAEELGDLLLNVALNAQIAQESDAFDILEALNSTNAKLVRRHPHVFGTVDAETPEQVLKNWEAIKRREEGYERRTSVLDGIPPALPALMVARKLQVKAARVGFDWERVEDVLPKVREELAEIEAHLNESSDSEALEMEVGDLLFAVVNLARFLNVEPEAALRRSNAKFRRRFQRIETLLAEKGESFAEHNLETLDVLWNQVKEEETAG